MKALPHALLLLLLSAVPLLGGINVRENHLLDAKGETLLLRGVNFPHAWYPARTRESLEASKTLGINAARMVLSNGKRWPLTSGTELSRLIQDCQELGLVAIVEVHDTTGMGEQEGAATLDEAVDYWLEHLEVLKGSESWVILNIANEPYGNGHPASAWVEGHQKAIRRLREAGLKHAIMVDAANWGQDWERITLTHAREVFSADPLANTLFSVHMYEVYPDRKSVESYLKGFKEQGLCLVVGEFADTHFGKPVAAADILELSSEYGVGYLGWSWTSNSSPLESLDLVRDWNPENLSDWGKLLFLHPQGIQATSRPASMESN
jgi:mannan endo-1,4-beta-mannosidase